MNYISTFGIISIVILVCSLVWDLNVKCKDSLFAYVVIGLVIAWIVVGYGHFMSMLSR